MIRRFGIDTSVLVRLVTAKPDDTFKYCVRTLSHLVNDEGFEIFASNQVIGETYIAVQHHYGISKSDVKSSLLDALQSGLVIPLNGHEAISILEASGGAGLVDRLISNDYSKAGCETLTLDRKMANLSDTRLL